MITHIPHARIRLINQVQRGFFYEEPYDDYFEDVFIVACNELFQPNGMLRVFIINTLIMVSQYIFWIFCWVVLPPLP